MQSLRNAMRMSLFSSLAKTRLKPKSVNGLMNTLFVFIIIKICFVFIVNRRLSLSKPPCDGAKITRCSVLAMRIRKFLSARKTAIYENRRYQFNNLLLRRLRGFRRKWGLDGTWGEWGTRGTWGAWGIKDWSLETKDQRLKTKDQKPRTNSQQLSSLVHLFIILHVGS